MRLLLLILLIIINTGTAFGQKRGTAEKTREVVLNSGDSIIVANILLDEKRIKTEIKKTYYWYFSGKISHNTGDFSGKLLNGKYQVFVQDKLVLSGNFEDGIKTGRWISWHANGSIDKIFIFKDGITDSASKDNNRHTKEKHLKKVRKEQEKKRIINLFNKKTIQKEDKPVQQ